MKKCTAIVAPKDYQQVSTIPGGGMILLDRPKQQIYKAWVQGNTAIWDAGDSREQALENLKRTALTFGIEIDAVIPQLEPEL